MMKKHSRVVFFTAVCLAGFIGQLAAFGATTNSVWDLSAIFSFKVAKINVAQTNAASAVFLSDGTCSLLISTNEFTGSYTNTAKQITLILGEGLTALKSNAVELITEKIDDTNITVSVKSVKYTTIKLTKDGVPVKETDTVSGTLSGKNGKGKVKTKSFSLKILWTDWVKESGTVF